MVNVNTGSHVGLRIIRLKYKMQNRFKTVCEQYMENKLIFREKYLT